MGPAVLASHDPNWADKWAAALRGLMELRQRPAADYSAADRVRADELQKAMDRAFYAQFRTANDLLQWELLIAKVEAARVGLRVEWPELPADADKAEVRAAVGQVMMLIDMERRAQGLTPLDLDKLAADVVAAVVAEIVRHVQGRDAGDAGNS